VHFGRVHELSATVGSDERSTIAESGMIQYGCWMGSLAESRKRGEDLVSVAVASGSSSQEVLARDAYATALMYSGQFQKALDQWRLVLPKYDRERDKGSAFKFGYDRGVNALGMSAYMLWETGYSDRALEMANEAIEQARRVGHRFSLAFTIAFPGADLSYFMRNRERALRFAVEGEEVARKDKFAYLALTCTFHRGWCLALGERPEDGLNLMREALAQMKRLGAVARRTPRLTAQLADALRLLNRADEGMEELALSPDRAAGARRVRHPEIFRIEGDLHLAKQHPDPAEAQRCYAEAIASAIEDGARIRQLRASTSLARLWVSQGKLDQARAMLEPLYSSFTEGFQTPDFQDARAVLEQANRTA
jgi:adenylate cyclase